MVSVNPCGRAVWSVRSLAGIAGSNPAAGIDVLYFEYFVLYR